MSLNRFPFVLFPPSFLFQLSNAMDKPKKKHCYEQQQKKKTIATDREKERKEKK